MTKRPNKKDGEVDRRTLIQLREDLRWLQDMAVSRKPDGIIREPSGTQFNPVSLSVPAHGPESELDLIQWLRPKSPRGALEDEVISKLHEKFDRRRRIWAATHNTLPHELLFDVREPVWEHLRLPLERALAWLNDKIGTTSATLEEVGQRRFRAEAVGDDRDRFVYGDDLLGDLMSEPRKKGDISWGIAMALMQLPRSQIGIDDLASRIDHSRIEGLGIAREITTFVSLKDHKELEAGGKLEIVHDKVPHGLIAMRNLEEKYDVIRTNWRVLITDRAWRDRWFTFNKKDFTLTIHDQPLIAT